MKSENKIREQANILIDELCEINRYSAPDIFSHISSTEKAIDNYRELKIIYDILEEPCPDFVKSLME